MTRDIRGQVDNESRLMGRVTLEEGAVIRRSEVRGPVIIGANTLLEDAFVGPYTSVGKGCVIRRSSMEHCVLLEGARVDGVTRLEASILGRHAVVSRVSSDRPAFRLMIGDDAEVLI
jgi:glucose-1-phosphate thymidylyltransferase